MSRRSAAQGNRELDLVRRCAQGRADAWREFLRGYGALVAHAARATLQRVLKSVDADQVDEAVQRVWTALCEDGYRRLRTFAASSALSTWLTVLTTRRTLDYLRTERRKGSLRNIALETGDGRWISDLQSDRQDAAATEEDAESLLEALHRLAPEDQLILKLYYLDGLAYRTIAQTLRVAPNTVSSYIFRARAKLKALLESKSKTEP